jgi:hypothetical protein
MTGRLNWLIVLAVLAVSAALVLAGLVLFLLES